MASLAQTWPNLLKHVVIILSIFGILTLGFFYVYLPAATNHGETLTVPDLEGMPLSQLDNFLVERNLRYEVSDSSFSSEYPALTVLAQFPQAGSKVKERRKVYLTVNSFNPPSTLMPDLLDRSLRNAKLELQSYELVPGNITLKPSPYENAILEQKFNGKPIEPGTKISKGSVIDLVVGDGYGNRVFKIPGFTGMPFDEVKISIAGMNLRLGSIINKGDSVNAPGFIYKQIPEEGQVVRVGEAIDLWVTPTDSLLNLFLQQNDLEENGERTEN
jgi:beta-lactam-binding protein with PASTA domain